MAEENKTEINYDQLTLQQLVDKKTEVKKNVDTKIFPQLQSAFQKKSERKKVGKLIEKLSESLNVLILLDEAQDRKDD